MLPAGSRCDLHDMANASTVGSVLSVYTDPTLRIHRPYRSRRTHNGSCRIYLGELYGIYDLYVLLHDLYDIHDIYRDLSEVCIFRNTHVFGDELLGMDVQDFVQHFKRVQGSRLIHLSIPYSIEHVEGIKNARKLTTLPAPYLKTLDATHTTQHCSLNHVST